MKDHAAAPNATAETPRKYPRSWMEPFLVDYAKTGNVAASASPLLVTPGNVFFQVNRHPEFSAAFKAIRARIGERILLEARGRVIARN